MLASVFLQKAFKEVKPDPAIGNTRSLVFIFKGFFKKKKKLNPIKNKISLRFEQRNFQ